MAENKWTPRQLQAINAESGTLLVSAAAGSGKTSVLVERIVRKLTDENSPCAPDELLVVTFTNAAAAEMRARIYKRLSEKMSASPEEYRRLAGLRARLDEMQVCTMDSFCMRLVREHFHACDVEPDFSVLENGEESVLKAQAVSEIIEYLFENDAAAFEPLARIFEKGRADRNLANGIIKLADFSMSEPEPQVWLEGAADHFVAGPAKNSVWGKVLCAYMEDALDYASAMLEKTADELSFCDGLSEKYSDMQALDAMLLEKARAALRTGTWNDIADTLKAAESGFASHKFTKDSGFTEDPHRKSAMAARKNVKEVLGDIHELMTVSEEENAEDTAALFPAALELIKAVSMFNMKLTELKKVKNAYSFSDISHLALSLLYDKTAPDKKTPLARELSSGLREILIDEYQDTNRAQDTLFTCLSRDGNNMFMVGDVKQSIYRFRLASPEIFIEKCAAFPYYDGAAKRSKIILSSNFRSRRGITSAVNFMFSALMSEKCGEIDYNDDEKLYFGADYYPEHDEPDTEIRLINNTDGNEYDTEAEYIAEMIKHKIEAGETVFGRNGERKAGYSDFCILLRSAKRHGAQYAAALRKRGIPVSLDAHEGFFDTAEIRLALSLLRAADDPSRDVELLAVMMSPVFGFLPDEAAEVRKTAIREFGNKKYSLYSALKLCADENGGKYQRLLRTLTFWRRMAAGENAAETVKRILADTSLLSIAGSMSDGAVRKSNLRALISAAEKFSSSGAGLSAFVRYMETLEANGSEPVKNVSAGQSGGVTVMTMHRSKGLEFPFVFIAGLMRASGGRGSELTVSHELGIGLQRREPENIKLYDTLSSAGVRRAVGDADISEELRVYYVAMTRAKEKLYIVAAPKNCARKIAEMQSAELGKSVVPVYEIKNSTAPWQWFIKAFSRHPDAGALRFTDISTVAAEGHITAVLDEPVEACAVAETVEPQPNRELVEKIKNGMDFSYRYLPVASAASKHTASNLASERFSPAFFGKSVPAFMYSSSLTPAERGTATHLFMQYCDFAACEKDPAAEKDRLLASGKLSPAQGEGVDMQSVGEFFTSDLYARIKASKNVWRERQFTVTKGIRELDASVPEEFADEKTVVIGKIDLIFTENGKAVIVDYKTDNVDDMEVLRARYKEQMLMYIEAVDRSLGLRVSECILYSIKLRKSISV